MRNSSSSRGFRARAGSSASTDTTTINMAIEHTTMPILSARQRDVEQLHLPAAEQLGQRFRGRPEHHQEELTADQADCESRDHPARREGGLVVERNEDEQADDDAADRPGRMPVPAMRYRAGRHPPWRTSQAA